MRRHKKFGKLNEENVSFNEKKNFIEMWLWDVLSRNRDAFGIAVIPNRGFTKDDQGTIISIAINYLMAEPQANETGQGTQEVQDYVQAYENLGVDIANTVIRDSPFIRRVTLETLLWQNYVRTTQYGQAYKESSEGSMLLDRIHSLFPAELPRATSASFDRVVATLAKSSPGSVGSEQLLAK